MSAASKGLAEAVAVLVKLPKVEAMERTEADGPVRPPPNRRLFSSGLITFKIHSDSTFPQISPSFEADSRPLAQDTVAGNTALHLAAADGHLEVVKVLAKALSPEELGALNDRGINALMVTHRTIIPGVQAAWLR